MNKTSASAESAIEQRILQELDGVEREIADFQARIQERVPRAQELRSALKVVRELAPTLEGADAHVSPPAADAHEEAGATPPPAERSVGAKATPPKKHPELSKGGLVIAQAAEIVLREAGTPLRTREIAERMLNGGYPYKHGVSSLRKSIGRELDLRAKNPSNGIFSRRGPGLYGLLAWERGAVDAGDGQQGEGDQQKTEGELPFEENVLRGAAAPGQETHVGSNSREGYLSNGSGSGSNPSPPAGRYSSLLG